jgi:hypothetical protein
LAGISSAPVAFSDHPCSIEIKKQNDCTNKFVFKKVTTDQVEKIINNINIKKATGADGIPAKIIKCSKSIIRQHTDFFQGHSASPLIT